VGEEKPEPFDVGWLDVGDGHRLYYEQVGVLAGAPIVYLHGGPGSGCTPALEGISTGGGIVRCSSTSVAPDGAVRTRAKRG
jgi:pimeloyl-ACP methyl ester carboxylesterase